MPLSNGTREYVQSLERGLRVLTAFSADTPRLSLSDAAKLTGLTRATARRCLRTLMELGYVSTDGKSFQLTPHVLEIGYAYLSSARFSEIAEPFMERLSEKLDESVSLAVLDEAQIVYIARVPTKRIMSIGLALGSRLPAAATSMGRVLLASLDATELESYLQKSPLRKYTDQTIVSPTKFRNELASVKVQGYALVDQELEAGLRSIAVPLRDSNGSVLAALNVGTQTDRVSKRRIMDEILPALKSTAQEINTVLSRR